MRSSLECPRHWVRAPLKRWNIEDTIRYVKTCHDLGNVRALTCLSLQDLMPLFLAPRFFFACVLNHDARLWIMASCVEQAAKRPLGIRDFK